MTAVLNTANWSDVLAVAETDEPRDFAEWEAYFGVLADICRDAELLAGSALAACRNTPCECVSDHPEAFAVRGHGCWRPGSQVGILRINPGIDRERRDTVATVLGDVFGSLPYGPDLPAWDSADALDDYVQGEEDRCEDSHFDYPPILADDLPERWIGLITPTKGRLVAHCPETGGWEIDFRWTGDPGPDGVEKIEGSSAAAASVIRGLIRNRLDISGWEPAR